MGGRRADADARPVDADAWVATIEERVSGHCARHGLTGDASPLLVLVSGGPDSLCLLSLLRRVHEGELLALVVDHGLRPEGADEAARAAEAAAALGATALVEAVRIGTGPSVQDQARHARWQAAVGAADEMGARRIATGHTADDQAETVLFRIARGSGRTGALGMSPRDGRIVRPILCLRAHETREWCRIHDLRPARDPSNDDPKYTRSRVRHDAMPALERVHPNAVTHLNELAELLRDESEVIAPLVESAWTRCATGGGLAVDPLAAEHPAIARLLVRRLLADVGAPGDARGRRSVERVLELLDGGVAVTLPGSVSVRRHDDVLVASVPGVTVDRARAGVASA